MLNGKKEGVAIWTIAKPFKQKKRLPRKAALCLDEWPGPSRDSEGWGADVSKPFDEPGRRGNLSINGIQ
jgi:hypothetical protein